MKPRKHKGHVMRKVEAEYKKDFWSVVADYSADGESIAAIAAILGYRSHAGLYANIEAHGMQHLFTRRGNYTNGAMAKSKELSDLQRKVFSERMTTLNIARNERLHHVLAFGHMDTITGHCKRHGVPYGTARHRLTKGMSIEAALFKGSYQKKQSEDHPWKK